MKLKPFSRKQLEVIGTANARFNILTGPVRSGKTLSSIVRWIEFMQSAPEGDLLMSGKTKHTIKRNVLNDLFTFIGEDNYSYNSSEGVIHAFGRTIHIVGANDEKAEGRIRGMTIAGWYDDETTLKPESFIKQGMARMSVEGAKAFWTTNPDSPYHPLYTEYVTNEALISAGIVKTFTFEMDDNLSLSSEYKESLKKLYTGLWYKRMILGLWVIAEGSVYEMFDDKVHVVDDDQLPPFFQKYFVGVDFGTSNATVFLLIGQHGDKCYVLNEYYHDSRAADQHQKTVDQYSKDFQGFTFDVPNLQRVYIDPSAAPLIVQFRKDGIHNIFQADNDVRDGISAVSTALSTGRLFIHKRCVNTIREFYAYTWDPKAQKRGEDKPMKQFDHAMDALRYPIYSLMGRNVVGVIDKPAGF